VGETDEKFWEWISLRSYHVYTLDGTFRSVGPFLCCFEHLQLTGDPAMNTPYGDFRTWTYAQRQVSTPRENGSECVEKTWWGRSPPASECMLARLLDLNYQHEGDSSEVYVGSVSKRVEYAAPSYY
jgi:hypothetical protein